MSDDAMRDQIVANLSRVLMESGHASWWARKIPVLGCSPEQAMAQGRDAEVLAVTETYLDPSFS